MADSVPGDRRLQCVVVTPEKAVIDEPVESIVLPMYDGELGVLPGRAALIGRLGPGELRTRTGETVKRYFVDGGFAQVRDNIVTVLTPRAVPAASINRQEAAALVEAPVATNPSAEARLRSQERGRAMLRVAEHASTSH